MTTPLIKALESEYRVAASDELGEGERLIIDVAGETIGLFRLEGEVFAYHNVCPHQGGPACQGRLISRVREKLDDGKRSLGMTFDDSDPHVVCPWHGFEFSIKTGQHVTAPNYKLRRFPIEERGGQIYVSL